ncbi:MAG TPA: hypothetical protein VJR87_07470 [Allosphingosinicella sp.]|nr:hypothetical protein [Allosphingosinicella sp.]
MIDFMLGDLPAAGCEIRFFGSGCIVHVHVLLFIPIVGFPSELPHAGFFRVTSDRAVHRSPTRLAASVGSQREIGIVEHIHGL